MMSRLRSPWALGGIRWLVLACACTFLAAGRAQAWWDGDWALRKLITVDTSPTGKPIGDPIGTAPVLIRLHDGDFRFAYAKPDGSDLRFIAADDKTPLSFHIEKFDSLLNEAFVWVKIPDLKPGSKTSFWLYYGNNGPKAVKADNAKDTYDPETVLVYHFAERGAPCFDSSGHGNNAENAGLAADGSLIGTGVRLDGKAAINIPSSPTFGWSEGGALTWSAWVKFAAPQPNAILFSRRDGDDFFLIGADGNVPFLAVSFRGSAMRSSAGAAVSPGWHHVAVVESVGRLTLYVDGDVFGSASAAIPNLNGQAQLGGDGSVANSGTGFVGEIDELEISRVARSAGYLKFAASEQGPDAGAKILLVGDDEQPSSIFGFLKKGYVGVIISSLTPDGWAVIGLLGVMSLISWYVMISKAVYLNRVGKSNTEFIREWRNVSMDLSIFDEAQKPSPESPEGQPQGNAAGRRQKAGVRNSPIYHIYQLGIEEVRHRLVAEQADGGGVAVISGRSIEAIRASLDGGFVRESQRLNSLMVLLTIAISGGPFLGLLGTVIGVMITFAAVAQAGDVNVNAIAPGIAAALAATVAGLAVAIPALFGYNYLLTRIKMTTSDMQVFIDEFVTRLAEFYEG